MLLSKVRAAHADISELQLEYAKGGMRKAGFTIFPRPFARHGLGCAAGSKPACRRFPAFHPCRGNLCLVPSRRLGRVRPRGSGGVGRGASGGLYRRGGAWLCGAWLLGHLPDSEIEAMLNELAVELGAALGQERIYVAFCDRTWILDAGEQEGERRPGAGIWSRRNTAIGSTL